MSYLENVPLDQLEGHPRNVRRDLGDLKELADSIKGIGLLEPLVIAPKGKPGEGFVVIGGHRRLAAAALAGLTGVPCILRPDLNTTASQIEAMLTENLQRTDLTVMEEADAYEQLSLLGVKDAAICKATGRSPKTVKERRLLAALPTPRREQFEKGNLSLEGAVKCGRLREKWADDAEILTRIDQAGTHAFAGTYGVEWHIDQILTERQRATEPVIEPADEEETLEGLARRAEWDAKYEKEREERAKLNAARKTAAERMYGWLSGRIATKDQTVVAGLVTWAITDAIYEYDLEGALELVGIEPLGDDEDDDDGRARIAAAAKQLDYTDQLILLALAISNANSLQPYNYPEHAEAMADLGYRLTKADKAAIGAKP